MSNSKTRLGRGLGGLISGTGSSKSQPKSEASATPAKKTAVKKSESVAKPKSAATTTPAVTITPNSPGYREIEIIEIVANPYQPRREIHEEQVEDLAQSIQSEGLLQPIVVRAKDGKFELIAGERRLRAYKFLKLSAIPARIIEASDASSAALALIENLQRENLNPIDEALGYASLVRDFDLTQEEAAKRVGKGRATVANALRLLTLGSEIQGFLSRRLISTGHAKVLLGLESAEHRKLLARRIIETGMSVREAEAQVRRLKESSGSSTKRANGTAPEAEQTAIRDLEKRMGAHFNTRVALKHTAKKGRIMIEYFGNDDLDRILEKLGLQ
ncbi:ParB/RepB/Spo0J family partition protein [Coraliomargarita sp. W4R53]